MSDLVKRLRDPYYLGVTPRVVWFMQQEAADRIEELETALQYYASDEAWTRDQVESAYGDYGKRARDILTLEIQDTKK